MEDPEEQPASPRNPLTDRGHPHLALTTHEGTVRMPKCNPKGLVFIDCPEVFFTVIQTVHFYQCIGKNRVFLVFSFVSICLKKNLLCPFGGPNSCPGAESPYMCMMYFV